MRCRRCEEEPSAASEISGRQKNALLRGGDHGGRPGGAALLGARRRRAVRLRSEQEERRQVGLPTTRIFFVPKKIESYFSINELLFCKQTHGFKVE